MADTISKSSKIGFAAIVPLLVIAVDQASKWWATGFFDKPMNICKTNPYIVERHDVLPFFDITLTCNLGISFGQLGFESDLKRWGLSLFAVIISLVLIHMVTKSKDKLSALSLGLIAGGALGNAIDRVMYGAVTDFLDFSGLMFPFIFNIADSAITCGVIGLILAAFFIKDPDEGKHSA